jgi:hypothetical protein
MITDIVYGDITSPKNPADIIIGMNNTLKDVTGIGRPYLERIAAAHPIKLGSVISFKFDSEDQRKIHMLICHKLGLGGWNEADRFVRFGLDYLDHTELNNKKFSIVNIGTGRVGKRDGARPADILTSITNSFLPLTLYIWDRPEQEAAADSIALPLVPYRMWNMETGEESIRLVA